MVAYKVFTQCQWGYEENTEIFFDLGCAKSYWKHLIRKLKEGKHLPDKNDDFYDIVEGQYYGVRKHGDKVRKGIIYKKKCDLKDNQIAKAVIPGWEKTSYEYNEWDIETENAIIEEIQIR